MKVVHRICSFLLALLGLSAYASDFPKEMRSVKVVEGFELEDSFLTVYGGRSNYITTKLYGTVLDKAKNTPLAGMKVALYSGTHEMAAVFTQEKGDFYFDDMLSVWAGLRVAYTMIISDPKGEFAPVRRDIRFELGDVTREEQVAMERK